MKPRILLVAKTVLVAAIFTTVEGVSAGSLTPPAGPVAATMKTLTDVEPRTAINATNTPGDADSLFKITQRGSYYLTGNITGVAGKMGIEIAASGVTLDLMGFDLAGVPGSLDGIGQSGGAQKDIAVINGSIRNWGAVGVNITSSNSYLANLLVANNTNDGITAGMGVVMNCSADQNGGFGINATSLSSTISNCGAQRNTDFGIRCAQGCTISNSWASGNTGGGFLIGSGSTITNCSAVVNTGDGISVSFGSIVSGNTCLSNGLAAGNGAGIHITGSDNRVEANNCAGNDRGIDVDGLGNFITRNICSGNTTNWDVAAGNVCLVVNAATAGAILGNSGGVAPGSTDPNANFTY